MTVDKFINENNINKFSIRYVLYILKCSLLKVISFVYLYSFVIYLFILFVMDYKLQNSIQEFNKSGHSS